MMKKIGFIGLGIMGKPMSKNLLKAGYPLVVYSLNENKVNELVGLGAEKGFSPKDVAARTEIVITMLPDSPQVKEVIFGENGIHEGIREGSMVVDMSSIAPLVSRELAEKLAEQGVRMLDAPVSGGETKAVEGTLSIMVGGEEEDYQEIYPVLNAMGSSMVYCGKIGAGNITKLANQIIVAVNIAAMSEALVLAQKGGVDPGVVFKAIRGGLAGSTVLDAKAPLILARQFKPGFRMKLHIKDLNNVLETGREVGAPLPLTSAVMEMMQVLKSNGYAEEDHGALVRYYEKLSRIEVSPQGVFE